MPREIKSGLGAKFGALQSFNRPSYHIAEVERAEVLFASRRNDKFFDESSALEIFQILDEADKVASATPGPDSCELASHVFLLSSKFIDYLTFHRRQADNRLMGIRDRAKELQDSGGLGALEYENLPPREPAADPFSRTAALIAEAREQFGWDLGEVAGLSLKDAESGHVVSQIIQICEETSSVLRTPQGELVTLKFNARKNETRMVALSPTEPGKKQDDPLERLPEFVPVPISSLSLREAAAATAIINGMRRAAIMTAAQRGRGGRKAAENTSPEQRKANASKAAKALSEGMTPEERSERARRAGMARQRKARAEREQGMNSEGS